MNKFIKILIAGIVLCLALQITGSAQNLITDETRYSLYICEKNEDSILSSFVMLFERIKLFKGDDNTFGTDINDVKEVLYNSQSKLNKEFVYDRLKVKSKDVMLSKDALRQLINSHPEGIVLLNGKQGVLVTSYDEEKDDFLCIDPYPTSPLGQIYLKNSKISSLSQADRYYAYSGTKLSTKPEFKLPESEPSASIIFHDGETNIFDVQSEIIKKPFYLSLKTPRRDGFRFIGWADNSISNEVSYMPGDIYTLYGDINLYAVYEKEETQHKKQTYTINYYSNEELIHTQTAEGIGFVKTTPELTIPQNDGYTFLGWRSSFYGENMLYPAYEPFNLCSDMNFYAVWRKDETYSITYSAVHATDIPYTQYENSKNAVISPVTPKKDGYIFCGWQTSDGTVFKPSQKITLDKDITLYAVFERGNASIRLETVKNDYYAGEPVTMNFNSISDENTTYEVTVINLEDNNKTIYEVKNHFEYMLPKGQYKAYVKGIYTYGSTLSNTVNFAVWEEKEQNQGIDVYADGIKIKFDAEPIIQNGVTLVPMRAILEAFNAQLFWNEETQTVTAVYDENVLKFTINKGVYYKNGEQKNVSAPPQIVSGRTLIPIRALAEGFEYTVHWQGDTNTIYIYSDNYKTLSENVYYITDEKNPLAETDIWVIKCINSYFDLYEIRSFYVGTYLAASDKCASPGCEVNLNHSGASLSALWILESHGDEYLIRNAQDKNLYLNNENGTPILSKDKYLFKILPLSQ